MFLVEARRVLASLTNTVATSDQSPLTSRGLAVYDSESLIVYAMRGKPDHANYMRLALDQARKSPPKSTNYCVGALLVDEARDEILSTGYTLELPGNTHAEQCCLSKLASQHGIPEEKVGDVLPPTAVIYTTMEPCNLRLSGNLPCADRIVQTKVNGQGGICKVYSGVKEPEKFVGENSGRTKLENHGVQCIYVTGFEDEVLKVATAGHEQKP